MGASARRRIDKHFMFFIFANQKQNKSLSFKARQQRRFDINEDPK